MKYSLFILRRAQRELSSLSKNDYKKIKKAILSLGDTPRPSGCSKLVGRDGWKIRVGNYRVIYEIDDTVKTITILHIGHRRDVYRKRKN
jgi:mRNA interferase RelE/StbE